MSSGGYFSISEKNPNFGEMKPTCGLPITKFASTLCLTPTYIQGQNVSHCGNLHKLEKYPDM
jgi:hypothetical protein